MALPHGDGVEGANSRVHDHLVFDSATVASLQVGHDSQMRQASTSDLKGMQHFADASQFAFIHDAVARKPTKGHGSDQSSIKVGNEANDFGGAASPEFNKRVQSAVDKLPKEYQDFLKKYHYPITTAAEADKNGDLGSFNAATNKITMPEDKLKDKSDDEVSLTLRHEISHAIDKQYGVSGDGYFSFAASKDFYAQQKLNLPPEERKRLDFYNDPHNRVELFAELFARLNGGTPAESARAKLLFPNASEWIEKNAAWPKDNGKK